MELNLHTEVKATLKVRIESLTPPAAPAEGAAPAVPSESKSEEARPRSEKRGYGKRDTEPDKAEKPEARAGADKKPRAVKSEKPAKAARPQKAEKVEKPEKA